MINCCAYILRISDANVFLEAFWVLFQQSKQSALQSHPVSCNKTCFFAHHSAPNWTSQRLHVALPYNNILCRCTPGARQRRGRPPSCCRRHKASHLWLCSVIQPQPLTQHTASLSSLRSKATSEAAAKTKGGGEGSRWSVGFRAQASALPCLYSVLPAWLINGVEGEIYSSPANIREHIYQNSATAWLHLLNVWSPT